VVVPRAVAFVVVDTGLITVDVTAVLAEHRVSFRISAWEG
jgi:hypothetical protein